MDLPCLRTVRSIFVEIQIALHTGLHNGYPYCTRMAWQLVMTGPYKAWWSIQDLRQDASLVQGSRGTLDNTGKHERNATDMRQRDRQIDR